MAADPKAKLIRLSIDARLQAKLEALAKESVARLGPKLSAAIVVVAMSSSNAGPSPALAGPGTPTQNGLVPSRGSAACQVACTSWWSATLTNAVKAQPWVVASSA